MMPSVYNVYEVCIEHHLHYLQVRHLDGVADSDIVLEAPNAFLESAAKLHMVMSRLIGADRKHID